MEAPPPSQLSARPVLWVERLGALEALHAAARALAAGEEVRYDERKATRAGRRLAGALGFAPAGLTLAGPDAAGFPLNDAREALLEKSVAAFADERLNGRPARLRSAFKAYYAG